MNALLAFISSSWGSLAALAGKLGVSVGALAFLGPLAPVVSGVAQFVGALVAAIGEILASLSKSAEGRVALAVLAATIGLLYLRLHYIEEGRTIERTRIAASQKPCPAAKAERRAR
ncbi:hypothetical protein [Rhodomicrobium lacus]|uniref:hypothetical protein n=1 Tax=Rhodomicrobium lacus TaxID=2498452 RepID=UPI0026E2C147|nr:hypothetical protein [Rhodomicrobium lacus]WKW49522.1 hypothetical protein QMO75_09415 [Rhodomicrobium lacus]